MDAQDGSIIQIAPNHVEIPPVDKGNGWYQVGVSHDYTGASNSHFFLCISVDGTKSGFVAAGDTDHLLIYHAYAWESDEIPTEFPSLGARNFIAITRRTADQMNVKQRMRKPGPSLRDL